MTGMLAPDPKHERELRREVRALDEVLDAVLASPTGHTARNLIVESAAPTTTNTINDHYHDQSAPRRGIKPPARHTALIRS
jgi:hypothetical protein